MIEFYMSSEYYEKMVGFGESFKKTVEEFVLNSIKVHLCEWDKDNTRFRDGRVFTSRSDTSDIDLRVELPDEFEVKLHEFSRYYDIGIDEAIQGIVENTIHYVENTIHYLNLNWTGHYGKDVLSLSDDEKVGELTRENDYENDCWNQCFG
jgi:hypothetical protein